MKKSQKLDGWDALIKKPTSAKAKGKMQASIICNIDQ